jgi:phosphatidylserine/phosphatidylglycerophosphate/cardiolipin synthase-like enzyme
MKSSRLSWRGVSLLGWIVLACFVSCTPQPARLLNPLPAPTDSVSGQDQGDWYRVYFTDPTRGERGSYRGGPDQALADALDQARYQIDVAVYDLNLWSIRDALLAAHRRGVNVRMVVEAGSLDREEIQDLRENGIPVVADQSDSLMHNKFVIIDGVHLWLGSMNFTVNGAYKNDNNLLHLRSRRLAENYAQEFEEMFQDRFFGVLQIPDTPYPVLEVNGTRVETYFSPDDGTSAVIVERIRDAEESIYFLAFSFTSDPISEALREKALQGVRVMGVFDEGQYYSNQGTEFDRLYENGIDVRLDGNPARMHHKVIIIDSRLVITGSYNFSASAETANDENTLIIHHADLARAYLKEFERVYAQAGPQ